MFYYKIFITIFYYDIILILGDVMNNINLNLLKYYFEVVNVGNITKASKNLLVSQPAITKAIKELENELNIILLERSKKGVIPTEEGKILYNHTKKLFQDFNSTLSILENNNKSGGHIYIGATTTNFLNYIMNSLNKFKNKFPNIHIHIELQEMNILSDMAKLGHLDILIKNDYETIDNFVNIKSFDITDKFIASKAKYKEFTYKTFSINELLKYPFILLSNITHGRRNFNDYLRKNNIEFKPTYEFNSYSLCKELIKNGFGIGIGNPIHYEDDDFIIIKTDFELPKRTFDIGYIKTSKNKLINEFINILKQKE